MTEMLARYYSEQHAFQKRLSAVVVRHMRLTGYADKGS